LRTKIWDLAAPLAQVRNAPDQQVSLTDRYVRAMASVGRGTNIVGYDMQVATRS
jgi:hypothetical protein